MCAQNMHLHAYTRTCIDYIDRHYITDTYLCISSQAIPLHEAVASAQQSSIQHLTVTNNANNTQHSSVQHQSTVQYALPDKRAARNKHQKVVSYINIYCL